MPIYILYGLKALEFIENHFAGHPKSQIQGV